MYVFFMLYTPVIAMFNNVLMIRIKISIIFNIRRLCCKLTKDKMLLIYGILTL